MKFPKTTFLLLSLSYLPTTTFAKDVILTCPSSGKGSTPIELKLTGLGGFELPKDQTIFLPLQFDHGTMEKAAPGKGVKFSCIYNSFVENKAAHKTVTLVTYTPSQATTCTLGNSSDEAKDNQLVCKY